MCENNLNEGLLTLGYFNRAQAHFTPKVRFVCLVWSLRAVLGSFSRPWAGWKRWARAWFGWARARHACTASANCAGARNRWRHFKQLFHLTNMAVKVDKSKRSVHQGPCVNTSQTTQKNKNKKTLTEEWTPFCWVKALLFLFTSKPLHHKRALARNEEYKVSAGQRGSREGGQSG